MNNTSSRISLNLTLSNTVRRCPPLEIYFLDIPRSVAYDHLLLGIIVFHAVTAAVATISNFAVIYTISRTPSLRTPSNILILGLAVCDFAKALLSESFYAVYKYGEFRRDVDLYCSSGIIQMSTLAAFASIAFVTLTVITGDRFLAVEIHLRYQELVTAKRYSFLLLFIWLASGIVCVSRFYFSYNTLVLSITLLLFLFCFVLNVFFLVKVYRVLHRHSLQIGIQQQSLQQNFNMPVYKKSVKTTFCITGVFLVCFLPQWGNILVHSIVGKHTLPIRFLYTTTEALALMNGVLNPFIYCWRIKDIRDHAFRLLRLKT